MPIQCGIVGLPNVGKSTLFNALTRAQIAAENYPFCTIDPNVGVVPVPDARLEQLAQIAHPEKIVPTTVEFVDIAGWSPAPRRAKVSATSSWRTSARSMRSRTWCAASRTMTSCMWRAVRSAVRHRDHQHRTGAGRSGIGRESAWTAPPRPPRAATRRRSCRRALFERVKAQLNDGKPVRAHR